MKRTWIVVLAAALAVPTMVFAQSPNAEPIPAWCGGSYDAAGTNFGECVSVETKVQVAGESSGIKEQTVRVPTKPEHPSVMVSFAGDKALFDTGDVDKNGKAIKKELNLKYVPTRDLSGELQAPGD